MGIVAIASYKPKRGMEKQFIRLIKKHIPVLRSENLITTRESYCCKSKNGTIIEIFEWKSAVSKNQAHKNKAVMAIWDRFFDLAEIVAICSLQEAHEAFASFKPLKL